MLGLEFSAVGLNEDHLILKGKAVCRNHLGVGVCASRSSLKTMG